MPILRRILKYLPAAALGLLIATSIASYSRPTGYTGEHFRHDTSLALWKGTLWFHAEEQPQGRFYAAYTRNPGLHAYRKERTLEEHSLGTLEWSAGTAPFKWGAELDYYYLAIPVVVLITATLPFAIGPFLSFRFRLWHYLAYTALVALQLAYYLRWQA